MKDNKTVQMKLFQKANCVFKLSSTLTTNIFGIGVIMLLTLYLLYSQLNIDKCKDR